MTMKAKKMKSLKDALPTNLKDSGHISQNAKSQSNSDNTSLKTGSTMQSQKGTAERQPSTSPKTSGTTLSENLPAILSTPDKPQRSHGLRNGKHGSEVSKSEMLLQKIEDHKELLTLPVKSVLHDMESDAHLFFSYDEKDMRTPIFPKDRELMKEILENIHASLDPTDGRGLAEKVTMFLAPFPFGHHYDKQTMAMSVNQWCEALEKFPAWCISQALTVLNSQHDENKTPIPAQAVKICKRLIQEVERQQYLVEKAWDELPHYQSEDHRKRHIDKLQEAKERIAKESLEKELKRSEEIKKQREEEDRLREKELLEKQEETERANAEMKILLEEMSRHKSIRDLSELILGEMQRLSDIQQEKIDQFQAIIKKVKR